jgi:hypothetical protein
MRLDGLSRSRRALLKAGFGRALVWPLIGWKSVQAATGALPFVGSGIGAGTASAVNGTSP